MIRLKSEPGTINCINVASCDVNERFVWFPTYDARTKFRGRKGINLDYIESIERVAI